MHSLNNRPTGLELDDAAEIARIYRRHQLARRIRRVSRVAIIAAKNDITSRQRRVQVWKRKLTYASQQVRANQYRIAAACALLVFGISSIVPLFLQADTSKSISLDKQVKALVGDSRDDANKYLTYDSKKSAYAFQVPETKAADTSEHTGRNADAYTTDMPVNARDGLTVTDTNTKIAVTLKPEFYMTPARKTDGNNLVYRSGNKQVIYTHKYNGLKEDIVLTAYQDSAMSFTFTLRLPSGVEARLDKQGNIGIYSSDPTLFGNISFDKEQDRISVEKAREKSEKNNLVMTIPYPIVKDSTGTEYSDRAKFTLSDKRITKSSVDTSNLPVEVAKASAGQTQLNEYTLTLTAENLKNLTYPISIDPTMQVRDAAEFGKLNIESGSDLDTTNSLIKRGGLTGGGLVSWVSNTTHLPYAAQKHGATMYNGYLYIHGGLSATGNDYRVYYAPINPATGVIGAFNPASAVVGAGRSTHGLLAYNGYMYIVGNGAAGGTGPTSYAKINSDGTLGTFAAATNQIIGRRFASYSVSNGFIYVAGGCTAFSSAVDTGDCTAFASTVEYAQIKPDGSLSAWQNTSAFTGNRMLGSMTTYNGTLYYAGGEDDGDLINNGVSFNTVFYAKQNSDGTLSAWQTNTMPGTKNSHQSVAYNGYIYEVGGYNAVVYYAPLYADGSIGAWITDAPLTQQTAVGVLLGANNNLFLVGGTTPSTGDEILVANVDAVGSNLPWAQDSGTSFATGRRRHAAAAYNGYLYIAGGCNTSSCGSGDALADVQYAPLNADGSVGTWATTSSLTTQRAGASMVIYNGVMYVSGGFQNLLQIFTTSVDRATINANGTLGTFTADSNNFSQGRSQHTSVAYNGFLYIIGGRDTQNSALATVERAAISSTDGSLGAFSLDSPLTTRRAMGKAVVNGGRIYMIGGCTDFTGGSGCTASTNTIEIASIASNGSLTWSTNPSNYPAGIAASISYAVKGYMYVYEGGNLKYTSIDPSGTLNSSWTSLSGTVDHGESYAGDVYNDFLYVTGGFSAGTRVDYTQVINGGLGGVASWTTGNTINPRAQHNVVTVNGFIYVLGGSCSGVTGCTSSMSTQVQYGTINSSTGAVTWATASNAISVRKNAGAFAYNGRIYVLGGCTNSACNAYTRTILYVKPDPSTGNITTAWTTNATNLLTDNVGVPFIAYDGYAYRIGGNVNAAGRTATTEYAPIDATTGAVGPTWTASATLNNATSSNRLAVYNGYLYSIGGITSGPAEMNVVESSKIQSNHSLGSWTVQYAMPLARQGGGLAVLNGYIYAIGGYRTGSNRLKDVQYAPILANGKLGYWQATTSLNIVKADSEAVIVGGRAYMPGGSDNSGNPLSDVEYGTLTSILRAAQFSRLYDFDVGVRPTKLITRGTKQTGSQTPITYMSSNNMTNALDTTQTLADAGYNGANPATISLGTNRTLSRYLYLRYLIDDSQSAIFPDSGTESYITDFDMYYTSNPGARLRGGRTFTNGADRGLEANPQ